MPKSVLDRTALLEIAGARGNVPASWVKTKYDIGSRRLINLWAKELYIFGDPWPAGGLGFTGPKRSVINRSNVFGNIFNFGVKSLHLFSVKFMMEDLIN